MLRLNSDITNDPTSLKVVGQAISLAQNYLTQLALSEDFIELIELAFGDRFDPAKLEELRRQWASGQFESLPNIEIRSATEINGAIGAFSADTNRVYLSREYIQQNATDVQAIANILLEEIGHSVDAQINVSDVCGDEGAIFSALAQGIELDEQKLQKLKAEDDTANLTLNGQTIQIEQATGIKRPILIVPGIAGTFAKTGFTDEWYLNRGVKPEQLEIDPLAGVYNDLIQTLKNVGYEEGKNLFAANYDWRLPAGPRDGEIDGKINGVPAATITDENFEYGIDYLGYWLKTAAKQWKESNGSYPDTVDVIAHSTGGLVARAYIQSDAYGASSDTLKLPKINNFFMIGVPNRGASKAWNPLHNDWNAEPAYQFVLSKILDKTYKKLFKGEAVNGPPVSITLNTIKDPSTDKVDPIRFIEQYVPTIRDLLATYNFIDLGSGVTHVNNNRRERNSFVLDLNAGLDFFSPPPSTTSSNSFADKSKVSNVTVIYGTSEKTPVTVTRKVGNLPNFRDEILAFTDFNARDPRLGEIWYQDNFLDNNGDGTVPVVSSIGQFIDDPRVNLQPFAKGANTKDTVGHTALVSNVDVQTLILQELGFSKSDILNRISTDLEFSNLKAFWKAATKADVFNLFEGLANSPPLPLLKTRTDSLSNLDEQQNNVLFSEVTSDFSSSSNEDSFLKLPSLLNEKLAEIKLPLLGNSLRNLDILSQLGLDDIEHVEFDRTDPDETKVILDLHKDLDQVEVPIVQDFGIPNLGLEVNGKAKTKIGLDLKLVFGANENAGFFVDTSFPNELTIDLDASIPDLTATGKLGLLNFKITDEDADSIVGNDDKDVDSDGITPTKLSTSFAVDLQGDLNSGFSVAQPKLSGSADINLHLDPSTPATALLPSISSDFNLSWNFTENGKPKISFDNVELKLGSFFKTLASPVLEGLQTVVQPLQALTGVLNKELPIPRTHVSIASLAKTLKEVPGLTITDPNIDQLITTLPKIDDLINQLPKNPEQLDSIPIELGSFDISNVDIRNSSLSSGTPTVDPDKKQPADSPLEQVRKAQPTFVTENTKPNATPSFEFPILTEPTTAVNLLLGKNVDLLKAALPPLGLGFTYEQFIPIFGPIGATIKGSAGAIGNLGFGVDSQGLFAYKPPSQESRLLEELPGLKDDTAGLSARISAGPKLNVGNIEASVDAGIESNLSLNLSQERTYISDIKDLNCVLTTSGNLSGVVAANLKINLFLFSYRKRVELARKTLADFRRDHCSGPEKDIGQATRDASGNLTLNVGEDAKNLNEFIFVEHTSGTLGNETVAVSAYDTPWSYNQINQIFADGAGGDDVILLGDNVITPAKLIGGKGRDELQGGAGIDELQGGDDRDTLLGGSGDDNLQGGADDDRLLGDGKPPNEDESQSSSGNNELSGNDTLQGGSGNDELLGGPGNDELLGGSDDDFLDGGSDNDYLVGEDGDDILLGGPGADKLNGGKGKDSTSYKDSRDGVRLNLSDREVRVELPSRDPITLAARSASGGDAEGDTFEVVNKDDDIENIEGSNQDDILIGNDANNVLDGGTGNDILWGRDGNDLLFGGPGVDIFDGGDGEDGTTYINSFGAVRVNLETGKALGGDAAGETLINIEDVQGSTFSDVLIGNASANKLDGAAGDDRITGGGGADLLDGGGVLNTSPGQDWVSYKNSFKGVSVDLKTGKGKRGDAEGDKLELAKILKFDGDKSPTLEEAKGYNSFENLEGSEYDDELLGDLGDNILKSLADDDTLRGDEGNDILIGGADADSLDGGNGIDWADYSESPAAVTVNLQFNSSSGGDAQGDTFVHANNRSTVENLLGSNFADALFGDDGDNEINPGLSNSQNNEFDVVDGGGGNDLLTLNYSFNDVGTGLFGGFTGSYIGFGPGSGFFRKTTDGSRFLDALAFSNVERLKIIGTIQDDEIYGGAGDDILLPGAGNDTIYGGLGSNTINADDGNDEVIDQNDADRGFNGTPESNSIINLDGGRGIDTLSVDLSAKSADIVLESTNPQQENPNQRFQFPENLGPNEKPEILITNFEIFKNIRTGSGNDKLTQLGRVNNHFKTGAGDDTITPGLGLDVVDGGFTPDIDGVIEGDDLLILDYSDPAEDTGTGILADITRDPRFGTFNASKGGRFYRNVSEAAQTRLDEVVFSNFERFQITGTSKSDRLIGGEDADSFKGQAGNDTLYGGLGNDTLEGGDGDDWLADGDDPPGTEFSSVRSGGNDNFKGGRGDDFLFGLAGDDQLFGEEDNDSLFGGEGNDTLDGGDGNDVLRGVEPFFSKGNKDIFTGGSGADEFQLGDKIYIYYDDRDANTPGTEDFATITDFDPSEGDIIQLHGSADDYSLFTTPTSTAIYLGKFAIDQPPPELIATVEGANLDLAADYIHYVDSDTEASNLVQNANASAIAFAQTDPLITTTAASQGESNVVNNFNETKKSISAISLPQSKDAPATISAQAEASESAFDLTRNNSSGQLLENLLGDTAGLSNFKIELIGDGRAFGTFKNDPFELGSGVAISTGRVIDLAGSNSEDGGFIQSGKQDLSQDFAEAGAVGDSISLKIEFDADATKEFLFFQYVFGSEEFAEFGGSPFNDNFSLTLNGFNYARLTDGSTVSINNLVSSPFALYHPDFIYNQAHTGPVSSETKLDGFTKPLLFQAPLIQNGRNTLVINVQDVNDGIFDSAVFIKGGTISTKLPTTKTLDGKGGQKTISVGADEGAIGIDNFGGVGRGSNPSPATIAEVDTLKFTGTGLTARNLILTQNGSNLEISFEGVANTQVTLKNFVLENLDNLVKATTAKIDLGNILFDEQTVIEDSYDVFNAEWQFDQVLNRNTVTFLNDLNNTIKGFDKSNDVINGQGGNDRLDGLSGDDLLRGGAGNDTLLGSDGDDILSGGAGNDRATGGKGRDRFILEPNAGVDTITDFQDKRDQIGLSGISFTQLLINQGTGTNRNNTLISFNNGGNTELLAIVTGVKANLITSDDFVAV